jgi:hypothetical protein
VPLHSHLDFLTLINGKPRAIAVQWDFGGEEFAQVVPCKFSQKKAQGQAQGCGEGEKVGSGCGICRKGRTK